MSRPRRVGTYGLAQSTPERLRRLDTMLARLMMTIALVIAPLSATPLAEFTHAQIAHTVWTTDYAVFLLHSGSTWTAGVSQVEVTRTHVRVHDNSGGETVIWILPARMHNGGCYSSSWVDSAGVTHTVTTPKPDTTHPTAHSITVACQKHRRAVQAMQSMFPPRTP